MAYAQEACAYLLFSYPDNEIGVSGTLAKHVLRGNAANWKPDAVISWNPQDVHPDHRAAYWATLDRPFM